MTKSSVNAPTNGSTLLRIQGASTLAAGHRRRRLYHRQPYSFHHDTIYHGTHLLWTPSDRPCNSQGFGFASSESLRPAWEDLVGRSALPRALSATDSDHQQLLCVVLLLAQFSGVVFDGM